MGEEQLPQPENPDAVPAEELAADGDQVIDGISEEEIIKEEPG